MVEWTLSTPGRIKGYATCILREQTDDEGQLDFFSCAPLWLNHGLLCFHSCSCVLSLSGITALLERIDFIRFRCKQFVYGC